MSAAVLPASPGAWPAAAGQGARSPVALGVLLLHLALAAGLLHVAVVQRSSPLDTPVTVRLLQTPQLQPEPPAPALPMQQRPSVPKLPWVPAPEVQTAAAPAPAISVQVAAPPEPVSAPAVAAAVPSPPASPAPPAPPAPPAAPRELPPGAIAYRIAPPVAVPLASRRLRESGTVWLRVQVDRQGLPVRVSLHRSSGYARLDEQAMAAMQQARFVPQTENGQPIEWVVIAPIAYEVD